MIFESMENWADVKAQEGLLFYVQRLFELSYDKSDFIEKSLGVYVVRIVDECLELLEIEEQGVVKGLETELQVLRDELKEKISLDPVSKSLLGDKKDRYLASIDAGGKELKSVLQLIALKLSSDRYWELLKGKVLEVIAQPKKKGELHVLADLTFQFLTYFGYRKGSIYYYLRSLFIGPNAEVVEGVGSLESFFKKFDLQRSEFDVYFVCSNLFREFSESCGSFQLELLESKAPEYDEYVEGKFFKNKNGKKSFIKYKGVMALDYSHAMHEAEKQVSLISDLFVLFHHRKKPWFSSYCLVYNHKEKRVVYLDFSTNLMSRLNEADIEHTKQFFPIFLDNFALGSESFKRFNRGVELHALSLGTNEASSQILNLWICLETLLITGKGTHISSVERSVKTVVSNYYFKERLNTLQALILAWDSDAFEDVRRRLPEGWQQDEELSVLALIGLEEFKDLAGELLGKMDAFPLLRYKFMALVKIYQSPKALESIKANVERRALYDVRRIYRTRNKIVHQGVLDSKSEDIVEVAHYYLDSVMNSIVFNKLLHENISSIDNFICEQGLFKAEHEGYISDAKANGVNESNIKRVVFGPDYI